MGARSPEPPLRAPSPITTASTLFFLPFVEKIGSVHPLPDLWAGIGGWEVVSGEEGKTEAVSQGRNSHSLSTLLCATDFKFNFLKFEHV